MKRFSIIFCLWSNLAVSQISGRVQLSQREGGLAHCTIRAYDSAAKIVASATTQNNGFYELAIPAGQTVRLEVSLPTATLGSGATWSLVSRQSRHRMVKSPATHQNWQAYQPEFGGSALPQVATPVYVHASAQATGAASTPAIVLRTLGTDQTSVLATFGQVGAVWGLAHDVSRRQVYAAALAKRHVGFGPGGSGAIYRSSIQSPLHTQLLYDFDRQGIATRPKGLQREVATVLGKSAKDAAMYNLIGQMSLGGLDVSADGRVLYVMNLYNRSLYGLSLIGSDSTVRIGQVVAYPLPTLSSKAGIWRPFAVKYHANRVFVGAVCDASLSQKAADLQAVVWSFDPSQQQYTEVLRVPLDYPRASARWHPWSNDINLAKQSSYPGNLAYAQPILSDIEFDTDGSMILGFMDRLGHQTGTDQPDPQGQGVYTGIAAGDVLRIAPRKPLREASESRWRKNLRIEQNARAGSAVSAGSDNGEGPAGGEFYFGDAFRWQGQTMHAETGAGGLALWHNGTQTQLFHTAHEPTAEFNNAGYMIFDAQTGERLGGVSLYRNMQTGYFAKANGVGDIELVTQSPPISIGSQVWWDSNQNGLFDPQEGVAAQVVLELYDQAGQLLGSTQTDAQGQYWFDHQNLSADLKPHTSYEIKIATSQGIYQGLQLAIPTETLKATPSEIRYRFQTASVGTTLDHLNVGLQCNRSSVTTQVITHQGQTNVIVSGYQPTDRFEWRASTADFGSEAAQTIPSSGMVWSGIAPTTHTPVFLKIMSQTGCSTERPVVLEQNLTVNDANAELQVYPNPVGIQTEVHLKKATATEQTSLQVVDLMGRLLYSQPWGRAENHSQLSTHPLKAGVYILKVPTSQGIFSKIIVKE